MIFQIKVLSILKIMSLNLSSESLLKEQRGRVRIFFPSIPITNILSIIQSFILNAFENTLITLRKITQ